MIDFEGTLLNVGDAVVYASQSYSGAAINLNRAIISGFTPKKVRLNKGGLRYSSKLFKVPC